MKVLAGILISGICIACIAGMSALTGCVVPAGGMEPDRPLAAMPVGSMRVSMGASSWNYITPGNPNAFGPVLPVYAGGRIRIENQISSRASVGIDLNGGAFLYRLSGGATLFTHINPLESEPNLAIRLGIGGGLVDALFNQLADPNVDLNTNFNPPLVPTSFIDPYMGGYIGAYKSWPQLINHVEPYLGAGLQISGRPNHCQITRSADDITCSLPLLFAPSASASGGIIWHFGEHIHTSFAMSSTLYPVAPPSLDVHWHLGYLF